MLLLCVSLLHCRKIVDVFHKFIILLSFLTTLRTCKKIDVMFFILECKFSLEFWVVNDDVIRRRKENVVEVGSKISETAGVIEHELI